METDIAPMDVDNPWQSSMITNEIVSYRSSSRGPFPSEYALLNANVVTDYPQEYHGFVVIDTNILLSHLQSLLQFKKTLQGMNVAFLIPWVVLQELDGLKKSEKALTDENTIHSETSNPRLTVGALARLATRIIHENLKSGDKLVRGQRISEVWGKPENNDDKVLDCCLFYSQYAKVILISNDRNLCVKALVHNIPSFIWKELPQDQESLQSLFSFTNQNASILNGSISTQQSPWLNSTMQDRRNNHQNNTFQNNLFSTENSLTNPTLKLASSSSSGKMHLNRQEKQGLSFHPYKRHSNEEKIDLNKTDMDIVAMEQQGPSKSFSMHTADSPRKNLPQRESHIETTKLSLKPLEVRNITSKQNWICGKPLSSTQLSTHVAWFFQSLPSIESTRDIIKIFLKILLPILPPIYEGEFWIVFGDNWQMKVVKRPPWNESDLFRLLKKHWSSVFRVSYKTLTEKAIDEANELVKKYLDDPNFEPNDKKISDFVSTVEQICSINQELKESFHAIFKELSNYFK